MTTLLTSFGMTDPGRVRSANEDQFLVANYDCDHASSFTGLDSSSATLRGGDEQLLAVADGLGGHRGGSMASAIAVQTLSEEMELLHRTANIGSDPAERLREVVLRCNREVFDAGFQNSELHGMGTTLTAGLVHEDSVWLAHVGDSRCYLLRDSSLRCLTTDHTLSELLGHETPSHVLWNCLGGHENRVPDIEVVECTLQPNDCLLFCTDGLIRDVSDEEIADTIRDCECLKTASHRLVEMANERGGSDNVTVVLARRASTLENMELTTAKENPVVQSAWNRWKSKIGQLAAA